MEDALIETESALEAACTRARAEGLLAVDTEFVWNRTYRPDLGLVQLGCRAAAQALDTTRGTDPAALGAIIADPSVIKIFHDARQDLTHIRRYTGATPKNVFDTQLAAAFVGFRNGFGLQHLLEQTLGVVLPKTETLTDWTRRPLTAAQVEYALDDVRYLPDLRDELLARAERFGTRAWLEEDLAYLEDPALYLELDPEEAWKRVKTERDRFDARARAVLRAVAAVREYLAAEWNLPRNWLGDDVSLREMVKNGRVEHFAHRLKPAEANAIREAYAEAIQDALALPEEECPPPPRLFILPEVEEAANAALKWLNERAESLHIATPIIATRATVTAYVDNVDDSTNPLASGWRYELAGREIAARFAVA